MKFLSWIVLCCFVLENIFSPFLAFATSVISVSSFNMNSSTSPLAINPGGAFRLQTIGRNTGTDPLTDVYAHVSFSQNASFLFLGNMKTQINSTVVYPSVSVSDYSSVSGLNTLITPNLASSINAVLNSSGGLNNFQVSTGITTYQNTISVSYSAKDAGGNTITSPVFPSRDIFVNVKPHITGYQFSKSSVVGNGADTTDLILTVKDYNGYQNIQSVTADLSQIGLSTSEVLLYDSSVGDGYSAVYKKSGITTLVSTGSYVFSPSAFTATDSDGNKNQLIDNNTTFDDEDLKTDLGLNVTTPVTPVVTISGVSSTILGTSGSSDISFSGDKSGTYKVVVNGNGDCTTGMIITDWKTYATGDTITASINASSLSEGNNSVIACVKSDVGDIGSASTALQKDITPPIISSIGSSASVSSGNGSVSFVCSENGQYKVTMNSFDSGYQSAQATLTNTVVIPNGYFSLGSNQVHIYCKDVAGNEASSSQVTITKTQPTPAMTNSGITLVDNDVDWDGVDGRDIKVTWDNTIGSTFDGFGSYLIYLLPENSAFTGKYIGVVGNSGATVWTGSSSITTDSVGNPLASGNYTAYVAIMGKSLEIGVPGSASGTLVSDVVPHPTVLSAAFTSTGNLAIKFSTPLNTSTGIHSYTGVTYDIQGTTYTGISINSVLNDTINIGIPNLSTTSATGLLSVATGAIWGYPVEGSYNYGGQNIVINDQIKPIISFSTGTLSPYQGFYSGSLNFHYFLSEDVQGGGQTRIDFNRIGGNSDVLKSYFITQTSLLSSGSHDVSVDLSALPLVSGAYYDAVFSLTDMAGNGAQSTISNIKFDNTGPGAPNLTKIGPNKVIGIISPNFVWLSSSDDNGNGSGIKGYKLRIYQGGSVHGSWNSCTGSYTDYDHTDLQNLSKSITLANMNNYAWGVFAYDNMDNVGLLSSCDNFYIDTNVPSFSNGTIKDSVLNSTSYAKGGNSLTIKANITNSSIGNISLNASSLKDSSYSNISCASPVAGVTCSYTSNIATYDFSAGALGSLPSGVKQVQFTASNASGINTGTYLVSTTLDNTAPTIALNTISAPISGTYGGGNLPITWVASNINDNIGLAYIKLEYSDDGNIWHLISTGANTGNYNWDISSLSSGNNYQLKLSAYDQVGFVTSTIGGVFIIDKQAPVVSSNALTYPSNSGIKLKGGQSVNIIWNTAQVTDAGGLASSPITLYVSSNGGTSYTQIATNLLNSGSYNWTVPSGVNATNYKIKLEATDNVGNKSFDVSDNNFEIDSTLPTITLSYAGNGGATPASNSFINASGFDVTAVINDTNLGGGKLYYSLFNQTLNKYFDGTDYTSSTEVWNLIDSATGSTYNLSNTLTSPIIQGDYYKMKLKADDVVGNSFSTSPLTLVGDTTAPTVNFVTASGTYFSGSLNITGTANDVGSGLSSVKIAIKKGTQYWNGTSFVPTQQLLATNTSDNYEHWNYLLSLPGTELDGENYEIIAYAYDKSYKINNTATRTIGIILDTIGPVIQSDVFTFTPSGFYAGGDNFTLTWEPPKITTNGAAFSHLKLQYNQNGVFSDIVTHLSNDGTYTFALPQIDDSIMVILTAYDALGNVSNAVASNSIHIDSTPPKILSIYTMDMSADGKIDALEVTMSEDIKDITLVPSDFSIAGVGTPSTIETGNAINDNVFILKFSEFSDTASTPGVTYTKGNLTDLAGKFLQTVSKTSLDRASPRILSAQIFSNSSGIFNTIEVGFSENILSTSDITAFTLNNGLNISGVSVSGKKATLYLVPGSANTDATGYQIVFHSNTSWKDVDGNKALDIITPMNLEDKALPVVLSGTLKDTNNDFIADRVELIFSETLTGTLSGFSTNSGSLSFGVITGNTLSYTLSGVVGTNPMLLVSYTPGVVADIYGNQLASFSGVSLDEKISPKFLQTRTLDQDGNGKIDGIIMDMSEPTNQDLSDFVLSVNGYVVQNYVMSGSQSIIAHVNEKSTYDTSSTPSVTLTSNNALTDGNGNKVLSQTMTALDAVGPVLIGARYEPSTHKIYVNFSETITASDFISSAFTLNNAGTYTVESVNFAEKSITLSGDTIDYALSTISFQGNSVRDGLGNAQSMTHFVAITAPIIINEVMVSQNANDNYIELHNLSSAPVSINNWTLAGITLPNVSIAANGYYLISASSQAISHINVVPDLVASIDFSGAQITLNNGLIDIDTASLSTGLGDQNLPAAIERKLPAGNGLLASSWYKSLVSNGFDTLTPLGTPGTQNVFDTTAPVLTVNMPHNTLLPAGYYALQYTYSDNIGVDTGSFVFELSKWNGTSFDILTTSYTTGSINQNNASINIAGLGYGRYRIQADISDTAGNISNAIGEFYVDDVRVFIGTGSVNLGVLEKDTLKQADSLVDVSVQTIGAPFDIVHTTSNNNLGDWDGLKGYGACEGVACALIENYQNKVVVSQAKDLQSSGNLKTYTYQVKYGALIDSLKQAGIYQINNAYELKIHY